MTMATYASDGTIPVVSACQLDIINKVIVALTPIEETTKSISEDNSPISVIIPLIRVLHKTLQQLDREIGVCGMNNAIFT